LFEVSSRAKNTGANEKSYVSGVSSLPLLGITIGQAFDDAVNQWAEKAALVQHPNSRVSIGPRFERASRGLTLLDRSHAGTDR
jgi:hypothetical protein